MTTAQEMARLIGLKAQLPINGLTFIVEIIDARQRFGRTDCLVKPATLGGGQRWLELESIKLI